jgi:hypothetical protein
MKVGDGSATLEGYHFLDGRGRERDYVGISELAAFALVFRRASWEDDSPFRVATFPRG